MAHVAKRNLRIPYSVFDTVCSELVPDETTKSDGVTEELQTRDWVLEDHHRSHDKQDVLQDSGKCENNSGGLADLDILLAVGHVVSEKFHTKKTTETFSMKATAAFAIKTKTPTR